MAIWNSTGADVGTNSVQDMHDNHAANGDTITVPNGTFNWATGVTLTKAVTLQALNMPSNTDAGIASSTFNPSPSSVQFANSTLTTLLTVNPSTAGSITVAGLNFLPGSTTQSTGSTYVNVSAATTNFPVLMHDCTWNVPNFVVLHTMQWFSGNGVLWHNHLFGSSPGTNGSSSNGTGSGGIYFEGSLPWWQRSTMGLALDPNGLLNVYVENNLFENSVNQVLDVGESARVVIRYNQINNSQSLTHGSTGISGGRHIEIYNNTFSFFPTFYNGSNSLTSATNPFVPCVGTGQSTFTLNGNPVNGVWPGMSRWLWMRAGTALIHDNTVQAQNTAGLYPQPGAWQFIDESLTRNSANAPCNVNTDYPGWHWCGTGGIIDPADPHLNDGTYTNVGFNYHTSGYEQVCPIYFWNNTYTGTNPQTEANNVTKNDQTSSSGASCPVGNPGPGPNNNTAAVFLSGRDYFVGTTPPNGLGTPAYTLNGFSSPGLPTQAYTPFTHPHPLISGGTPTVPSPPVITSIVTGPTPSFVQANGFVVTTTATSNACPYNSAQVAGHCNLAWILTSNAVSITSVTDTAGNTYTQLFTETDATAAWQITVYISNGIKAATTNTVTAALSATSWSEMIVEEYSSIVAAGPLDVTADGQGTGTSASATITTVNTTDVVISMAAYVFPVIGVTTPGNWNLEFSTASQTGTLNLADIQVYNPGAYTPTWTLASSKTWDVACVALKSTITVPPNQTQVNLSWPVVSGATTYHVKYGTTSGGPYTVVVNVGNVTSYTQSGLNPGTYYFVVSAFNSVGESANSNQVVGNISGSAPVPINASVLIR